MRQCPCGCISVSDAAWRQMTQSQREACRRQVRDCTTRKRDQARAAFMFGAISKPPFIKSGRGEEAGGEGA
jgi:hypothetical protein